MELIYTDQQSGFEPNKHYRNPLYFERAENGVSKVIVHGDYPAVVQAYQANGVEVVQVEVSTVQGEGLKTEPPKGKPRKAADNE